MVSFDTISNLYDAKSIVECYEGDASEPVPGIKDENGGWNTKGHPDRIIHVTKKELALFSKLFDENDEWKQARLPMIHTNTLIAALDCFSKQDKTIASLKSNEIMYSVMFFEAADSKSGIIKRNVHFPVSAFDTIISGPHIGVANPRFKTSRSICKLNSDYDNIDLTIISEDYRARCNYSSACTSENYLANVGDLPWGGKYNSVYRIGLRKMLNQGGERTLIAAVIPPDTCHIDGIYSLVVNAGTACLSGTMASIPYDFYIKATGKSNGCYNIFSSFPLLDATEFALQISCLSMLLNCLTTDYKSLWKKEWKSNYVEYTWSKFDQRLANSRFSSLTSEWTWDTPLRTDYERRQALVEIDVLT